MTYGINHSQIKKLIMWLEYIIIRPIIMSDVESNLILFLMLALVVFFIYIKYSDKNEKFDSHDQNNESDSDSNVENFEHKNKKHHSNKHKFNDKYKNKLCDIIDGSLKNNNKKMRTLNSDFIEMQYHSDYNDTITAINNLTPQKELFNQGFLPVKETVPNEDNVNELIDLFMGRMNKEIISNVSEFLHVNSGWSDMGKRKREKSGFEQQMEELGLPGSIYAEPASKAPIKLIKIDKAEQYNTEDQIRFVIYIIIQKENVEDQMVLKVQFFLEREDLKSAGDIRENFFKTGLSAKIPVEQKVIIEQVFTVGYLTNKTNKKTSSDKFHDYKNIRSNDGTINQEQVIKIMLQKHKERQQELNSFMNTVDDDTKELHDVPGIDDYSIYKNTRTIMDDLAKPPQKSFGDITI
jgi:hypothetical protein